MLEQFKQFVRSKPADEAYDYGDIHNCALAQFGQSLHPDKRIVAGSFFFMESGVGNLRVEVVDTGSDEHVALCFSRTFGELAAALK